MVETKYGVFFLQEIAFILSIKTQLWNFIGTFLLIFSFQATFPFYPDSIYSWFIIPKHYLHHDAKRSTICFQIPFESEK